MQTTSDTALAGYLIRRGYNLTSFDRTPPRFQFTFAEMTEAEFAGERAWFEREQLGKAFGVARALAAACKGKPVAPHMLEKWPCLSVLDDTFDGLLKRELRDPQFARDFAEAGERLDEELARARK